MKFIKLYDNYKVNFSEIVDDILLVYLDDGYLRENHSSINIKTYHFISSATSQIKSEIYSKLRSAGINFTAPLPRGTHLVIYEQEVKDELLNEIEACKRIDVVAPAYDPDTDLVSPEEKTPYITRFENNGVLMFLRKDYKFYASYNNPIIKNFIHAVDTYCIQMIIKQILLDHYPEFDEDIVIIRKLY